MRSAAFVLAHHGSIARGSLLARYGLDRRMLCAEVETGSIVRVRQGVFALPTLDPDVRTAAEHGGALTCRRALRLHGLWVIDGDDTVHVWMGGHGRSHHLSCDCIVHSNEGRAGLGLAPIEDALVHSYRCAGDEVFFTALESALAQRKLRRADLARIRRRIPPAGRRLIDLARTDADSGLESLLRLRLHLLGVSLECQVELPNVGRVDFVVGGRLILEADGRQNHESPSHMHRDRVRDAAASALGYETLRFDYAQIVHDWSSVAAAITAAIARLHAFD
ncbi:endonuclease domain-containing protein [Microbacterium sp. ZW T5_45]|uniref:endonuclease domain-containing protein n=1 Tax=Microbacterium sp. ZW T5_45 TaxID=3378080 RepID=UPI003853E020